MPLSGTDSLVPGALKPLLDMRRGGNSVNRTTQSSTEGHFFSSELDDGVAMNREERDEISRVVGTNSGVTNSEKSHKEASERVSTVPGRDWAGGFQ